MIPLLSGEFKGFAFGKLIALLIILVARMALDPLEGHLVLCKQRIELHP